MAEFFSEYGLFLAKTLTVVAAFIAVIIVAASAGSRNRPKAEGVLEIHKLNQRYDELLHALKQAVMTPVQFKEHAREKKRQAKELKKADKKGGSSEQEPTQRVYVLDFEGDIRANAVNALREEISAVLRIADNNDEVVLRLESPGGVVGYA